MSFKSPKYCLHFIFFAILIIVSVHFIMEAGLSYVNDKYCYRTYMKSSGSLINEYKNIYDPLQS